MARDWGDLLHFLQVPHPAATADGDERFTQSSPEQCEENLEYLREECRVLVVGAGALGCEVLYGLAQTGFGHIEIIDMDTIEVSNLNRQFLFTVADVGKNKADVAAAAVRGRFPDVHVIAHVGPIQSKPKKFFASFNIIIGGLDNVEARRWLNSVLHSLLVRDEDGEIDPSSIVLWFDGGSQGLGGQVKAILPGMTACFECNLWSLPTKKTYPLCTIADQPRTAEHCIEYALVVEWPKKHPGVDPDLDDSNTIQWLLEAASNRAAQFNIEGVSLRLVLGVAKNIVPAVSTTNAIVGAGLVLEAFKVATYAGPQLNSYLMVMGADGIYYGVFKIERQKECPVCANAVQKITVKTTDTLQDVINNIINNSTLMLTAPSMTQNGNIVFLQSPPTLREAHAHKLEMTLHQLSEAKLLDLQAPLLVTDPVLSAPITLLLVV